MPQIVNIPDVLVPAPGVDMKPPPLEYMDKTLDLIHDATNRLAPGDKFLATVWVNTSSGVNAALVSRINGHSEVVGWIGKTWGEPIEAGIAATVHF